MKKELRTTTARFLAVAALAVCALAWGPAALAASTSAGVAGTVVDATSRDPVPHLQVTLHLFSDTAELGSLETTTDAKGAFSFPDLATDAKGYQVTAVYKNVSYSNQMAALTPGTPVDVTLKVYETTSDPADIIQSSWIVWVDREGSGFAVQHDLRWTNGGDTAYAGSAPASGGAPIATQVPLATGATNFQFRGTFLETPGQVQGSTYVNPQPIVPGTTGGTIRYNVDEISNLTLPIDFPTASLELYVPTGVDVKADGLTPSGQVTDRGVTYQRFAASDLQAGDTVDVSLSGLAAPAGNGKGSTPILWGVIGGLLVVAAGGLVLWKLAGRSTKPARGASGRNATVRTPAPSKRNRQQVPAKSNGRRARLDEEEDEERAEERFDLLIDEIAALDLAHEQGLLEQRTYEALRADAKERLLRLRTGERSSR